MTTYEGAVEALAEENRRAIVERLREGGLSVGQIAEGLPVTRPAVSQHLSVLRRAGLVRDRREGTRRIYTLDPAGFEALRGYVESFWDRALAGFVSAAEREEEPMETTDERTAIEPVRRSVTVRVAPERAFEVFADLGSWWPLEVHSIAVDDPLPGEEGTIPETVVLEPREGGRIIERWADGREFGWGTVLAWDPPRRLVIAWSPTREERAPTEIEVTFTPQDGGTRVDLEHRNWEAMGERGAAIREGYASGWGSTLDAYASAAEA